MNSAARRRASGLIVAIVVGALVAAPMRALADEDVRQACADAAVQGQHARKSVDLVAARRSFAFCARDACPSVVQRDCVRWLSEVEDAMPTVVVAVRDALDHDVISARVSIDGQVVPNALDGKAIVLNPGRHTLRFEPESGAPFEEVVVAREHEKGRSIVFRSPATPPAKAAVRANAPSSSSSSSSSSSKTEIPTLTYVLGGLGIAATASFAYFAARGLSDRSSRCSEAQCSDSDYDTIKREYLVADVSLGVAALAIGGAFWSYLAKGSHKVDVTTSSRGAGVRWGVAF